MLLKQIRIWLLLLAAASVVSSCAMGQSEPTPKAVAKKLQLVDVEASRETRALYYNLLQLSDQYTLFGHQDDLAYGVKWEAEPGRSDVKEVCGSYPGVFGWDVSKLGKYEYNIDTVDFKKMQEWVIEAYKMGGVNTISWHLDNLSSGGDSWDISESVVHILPGGKDHAAYQKKLDLFADFVKELKVGFLFKRPVPIIFRPFHEHTGGWFWWGSKSCTVEQYKALWQYTVKYLRDEKGLHNVLYAYSPDVFNDKAHYLERYPGDEYVDIIGLDDYHDVGSHGDPAMLTKRLRMVVEIAEEKGKVAALSETGFEAIPRADWWTEVLLKHIEEDPVARRIAYMLLWRNDRLDHHYAPYPGHVSAADFVKFSEDPAVIFAGNYKRIYRLKR